MPPLNLEKPRRLDVFKEFLQKRKEVIEGDLKKLSELFNISVEELLNIRYQIRKIIGEDFDFFSTTIHFEPYVIDFLRLGKERIDKATDKKTFYYPVFYQLFDQERPDIIDIGEIEISLIQIIPNFSERKKNGEFLTSQDFHQALLEYLKTVNWQGEIKQNIETYINKNYSHIPKEERNILIIYAQDVVIGILSDYQSFFEDFPLNTKEEITKLNSKLAALFLENFKVLEPILKELNISEAYLKDLKDGKINRVTIEFFTVILSLGGYVHIGAEYGKFNEKRKKLGLTELLEPPLGSFQERFKFFEPGPQKIQSGTLRFVFGNSKLVRSFSEVAIYQGLEEARFSPLPKELRDRIRLVDFYLKNKNLNYTDLLNIIYLNFQDFQNILNKIEYFFYLKEEEKKQLEEIFNILKDNSERNIKEWIDRYNENIENTNIAPELKNKLKIREGNFQTLFTLMILRNYVDNLLQELENELPEKIYRVLQESFLKDNIIEQINLEELPSLKQIKQMFFGVQLPIELGKLGKKDVVNLAKIFHLAENKFEKRIALKLLKGI